LRGTIPLVAQLRPAADPTGPVDPAVLASLKDLGGTDDPAFFPGLLREFLQHANRAVADLRSAAATGARDRVRAAAHSLKGSAGNVGAKRLSTLSRDLEMTAKAPAGDLAAGVEAIAAETERVRARLSAELSALS
jgi:HPt (histidine-containing phosphotransfer) domain-containing protein